MKYLVLLSAFLILSCSPYPRYRKGGAEKPPLAKRLVGMTTDQHLKLGDILQSYLGKPYQGSSKYEEGVDCSLFTREVFKKYNATLIPRTVAEQFKAGRETNRRQLQYGDLVFFRTERNLISHVGIYIKNNQFIHASTSRGVIISGIDETYWSKRYVGARRLLP